MNNSIKNKIQESIKGAMIAKQKERLEALRLVLSAIKAYEINKRSANADYVASDSEVMQIMQTMTKQRKESIAMYEKASRQELADKEQFEISIIQEFLPKTKDPEEVREIIKDIIAKSGYSTAKDMGLIIKSLKADYPGSIDMSVASKICKELLS